MEEEREINIRFVLYYALKQWRRVIQIGIVIALLGAAYSLYGTIKVQLNDDAMQKAQSQYQIELDNYNAVGKTLKTTMENIETNSKRQTEYNEKSVLMKIDPMNEYIGSFSVYIDSEYQIMPDMTYQNTDITYRLLAAYSRYISRGELYQYVLENTNQVSEIRYLSEILKCSVDYSAAVINVTVYGVDEEDCREIMGIVREGIEQRYQEFTESIGKFSYSVINESVYSSVDFTLDTTQKNNIQYVSDLTVTLAETNTEYKEWEESAQPKYTIGTAYILKQAIKYMILAGVIGVLLGFIYYACMAVISGVLLNSNELKNRLRVNVLAEIPSARKRKRFLFIDKLCWRLGDIRLKADGQSGACALLGSTIDGMLEKDSKKKVAVIGTADPELIQKYTELAGTKEGYQLFTAGNILSQSEAAEQVQKADAVILMEQQDKTTYSQIEAELEYLKLWKMKPLGVVVTEADAER